MKSIYQKLIATALLVGSPLFLIACPKSECAKYFYLVGTVVDYNGVSLSGVDVYYVDSYGTSGKVATTGTDGKYTFKWGRYVALGNGYMVFKKAGYQDFSTEDSPIGDGKSCSDQTITRDAVMTPLN